MNIRRLLCCILSAAMLSGCAQIGTSVEGLMTPPKLSDEQTEIKQALINSVGRNVKLKYPKTGEYRSAYVIADIDGEGTDEALVFYEKTGVTPSEPVVRMAVLDKTVDGKWNAVFDAVGDGSDIDKVLIGRLGEKDTPMIFIGYSLVGTGDKYLTGYTYSDGAISKIMGTPYVSADITDLAEEKGDELAVLKRGEDVTASDAELFTIKDGIFTILSKTNVILGSNGEYTSINEGKTSGGENALFLDVPEGNGTISTQVLYCTGDTLKNPVYTLRKTSGIDVSSKVTRPSRYVSSDINSDGVTEIPSLSVMPGYETADEADKIYLTDWYQFDTDTYVFTKKSSGYYSITDGYCLMLPSRWSGTVTVKEDIATDEIVFFKYEGDIDGDMTELLRISVRKSGDSESMIRNGYTVLAQNEQFEYYAKIPDTRKEPLVPTKSELLYNFILI